MKLLLFYAPSFWFKTYQKVLEQVPDQNLEADCHHAVVVFYHVEAEDLERSAKVLTKLIKNIKWLAGKVDSQSVGLNFFTHLSCNKCLADLCS